MIVVHIPTYHNQPAGCPVYIKEPSFCKCLVPHKCHLWGGGACQGITPIPCHLDLRCSHFTAYWEKQVIIKGPDTLLKLWTFQIFTSYNVAKACPRIKFWLCSSNHFSLWEGRVWGQDLSNVLSQVSAHVHLQPCSPSTNNWEWAVARRRCLNGSTIPLQAPIPDAKLASKGTESIHLCCPHKPNGWESCIVLESGPSLSLVAKLLQCLSLAVHKFHIAIEER